MSRPKLARDWKMLYAAAMLESDPKQLRHSIERAIPAIQARFKELEDQTSITLEMAELHSALSYLRRVEACLALYQRHRGGR